jgi:hypothetical protein
MESCNVLIIFNCDILSSDDDRDIYCNFRETFHCEIEAGGCDDVEWGRDECNVVG